MAIEKKFVREQMNRLLIAEFLQGETDRAGFGGIDIQRTPMGTRVSLIAERPGMVIGRRGSNISRLTSDLAETFKAENPQIEVIEAGREANLNAQIMARKVAEALERGWHFRRAGHSTVRRIMESGAKGCIVILSGKLTGQRHRTEKFIQGHIKYNGDTALQLMDIGYAQCKKKLGTIGCTVKIMHPDARLPDEIQVFGPGEKELARQAATRPPVQEQKPQDETPAEERPEGVAVPGSGASAPQEETEERRSRRRVPSPQPTEEDRREAEELARRMKEEREQKAAEAKKKTEAPAKPKAPEPAKAPEDEKTLEAGKTPEAEATTTPAEKPVETPAEKPEAAVESRPAVAREEPEKESPAQKPKEAEARPVEPADAPEKTPAGGAMQKSEEGPAPKPAASPTKTPAEGPAEGPAETDEVGKKPAAKKQPAKKQPAKKSPKEAQAQEAPKQGSDEESGKEPGDESGEESGKAGKEDES